MKTAYAACLILFAVLAGSAIVFRNSLPPTTISPATVAQVANVNLPPGAIFIPAGDDTCRMHALDNATGQIMDYGVVKCSQASKENLDGWRRATSQDRFIEIGKSFRHEDSGHWQNVK